MIGINIKIQDAALVCEGVRVIRVVQNLIVTFVLSPGYSHVLTSQRLGNLQAVFGNGLEQRTRLRRYIEVAHHDQVLVFLMFLPDVSLRSSQPAVPVHTGAVLHLRPI